MSEARKLTRRDALVGAAAAAAATAVGSGRPSGAVARPAPPGGAWRHGGALAQRGLDVAATAGRNKEARFGLMFKRLDAFAPPDDALVALAWRMRIPVGLRRREAIRSPIRASPPASRPSGSSSTTT